MPDLDACLARIRGRWITGGAAAELCPPAWADTVRNNGDAELTLLALTGQATQIVFRPKPGRALTPVAPIPRLTLPPLPEAHRPRFRRIMAAEKKDQAVGAVSILALLAARGYAAHPADWMPERGNAGWVSDLYAPWLQWLCPGAADEEPDAPLTAETWGQLRPGERREQLRWMRSDDPAAARALIEACAAGEGADERTKLTALLELRLSDADRPYLQSLSADRSARVRSEAERLLDMLARDSSEETTESVVQELMDHLEVDRERAGQGLAVQLRPRLSLDQRCRCRELFGMVAFTDLAEALAVNQEALASGWRASDTEPDRLGFYSMVVRTGSDAAVRAALNAILERGGAPDSIVGLAARLGDEYRDRALDAILRAVGRDALGLAMICAGDDLGRQPLPALKASPVLEEVRTSIIATKEQTGGRLDVTWPLARLGLLARQDAAAALIDILVAEGLPAAHPALAVLQLNAALSPASTET